MPISCVLLMLFGPLTLCPVSVDCRNGRNEAMMKAVPYFCYRWLVGVSQLSSVWAYAFTAT